MATNMLAPQGVSSRVGSEHGNIAVTKAGGEYHQQKPSFYAPRLPLGCNECV